MVHILCLRILKTLFVYLLSNLVVIITQGSDLYLSPSPPGEELILPVGSSLTLECLVNSSNQITKDLVFTRDGVQLDFEFKMSHSGSLDGSSKALIVHKTNVTCSDGGTYLCILDTMSKRINVTIVKVTTRDFTISNVSKYAILGCHPEICGPSKARSSFDQYQFHVSWMFHDHEVLVGDARYQIAPEAGDLSITSPEYENYGIYTCKVNIKRGGIHQMETLQTTIAHLKGPPRLRKVDSAKNVCLSDHVTLICEAAGFPLPHLEWCKNGSDVETNSTRIHLLPGGLYIQSFTAEDTGEYTCVAKSEEFPETDRASISVNLKDTSNCVGGSYNSLIIGTVVGCGVLLLVIVVGIILKQKRRGPRQRNLNDEATIYANLGRNKHREKKRDEPVTTSTKKPKKPIPTPRNTASKEKEESQNLRFLLVSQTET